MARRYNGRLRTSRNRSCKLFCVSYCSTYAKLGEAWFRQQIANEFKKWKKDKTAVSEFDPKEVFEKPWESRTWWKKERMALAVLQIAAANAQRVLFFGEADIVALSGENILAFVSICREIWESWGLTQAESTSSAKDAGFPPFDKLRQDAGIRKASGFWREKPMPNLGSPFGATIGTDFVDVAVVFYWIFILWSIFRLIHLAACLWIMQKSKMLLRSYEG